MSVPKDKELYNMAKEIIKAKVNRWPSAYASAQLVQLYKSMGGEYYGKKARSNLSKWFKEEWVDISRPYQAKGELRFKPCGRKDINLETYPFCRPTIRVDEDTPETLQELLDRVGIDRLLEIIEEKKKIKGDIINTK